MFEVRYLGTLPVQYQGNDVARKTVSWTWAWLSGVVGPVGLIRFPGGESGVEEFDLLRHAVLNDGKVRGVEISNRLTFFVFRRDVEAHEI